MTRPTSLTKSTCQLPIPVQSQTRSSKSKPISVVMRKGLRSAVTLNGCASGSSINAPRYRGQFDQVWLWKDWPERWGADAGIDIVARTRTGELWAIQSKADHPDRAIPKREIDSFLSESSRPEFACRPLMATTDDIGATTRRTLHVIGDCQ